MRIPRAALVALVLAVSATSAAAEPRLLGIPTHVPAGGRLHIRWTGRGQEVHEAELELSLGGGRWTRISPELEAREGGFTWQLPAELSGPARLRLRYGGEGFEAEGRVSAPFVIERPAGVTQAPTLDAWSTRVRADGGDPEAFRVGIIRSCLVTDDRERDWAQVRLAERRRMELYNRFRAEAGGHGGVAGITEAERIPQTWVVGSVDHCVAELSTFIEEYRLTDIVSWAVPPGLRPQDMNESLERFARDVAPRLRARFGAVTDAARSPTAA